jgi:hypothetical protein
VGGSPPKHDWEAFWIQVAIWAARNDLVKEDRPRLQKHMTDWTATQWPTPPDPATIRKKLSALFNAAAAQN